MSKSTKESMSRRELIKTAGVAAAAVSLTNFSSIAHSQEKQIPNKNQNKVAIVTGSSRGIGAATVKRLAADGFNVVVNYRVSKNLATKVVKEIEASGGRAIAIQADVRSSNDVKKLFDAAEKSFGGIDIVINNAGVMKLAPFATMSDEDFETMMDTNLKGGFNVLREASKRVRDHGRIISLSSSIIELRTPTYGPYAASKIGLEMYSSCLAKELQGRMISVNAISPGLVNTSLFTDGKTSEQIAGFAKRTPHGKIGEPEDIAKVISIMCSEDGWWINGRNIFANGGVV